MEGTAVILISSQRGEGPVLLYKNIFAHGWFQLINTHENYIYLDMEGTHIVEKCNRICIP